MKKSLLVFERKRKGLLKLKRASTEKSEYKYILEFTNEFRVYTNDDQFLLNTLKKYGTLGPLSVQHDKGRFIGALDPAYRGKPRYEIFEGEKRYNIISSRSKNKANCPTVNKDAVEKVYNYLKKDGRKRSVSDIEKALRISSTTIHNITKVLRVQKRVDLKIVGKKRQFFYRAL